MLPSPHTRFQCVLLISYLNINQLDALNFIMSLFHASTCFEHVLIVRRSKLWWYQRLYSTILSSWRWAHVLETCRGKK